MRVPVVFMVEVDCQTSVPLRVAFAQVRVIGTWLAAQVGCQHRVEMQEWRGEACDLFCGQQRGLLERRTQLHPFWLGYLGDGQQVIFAGASLEECQAREECAL